MSVNLNLSDWLLKNLKLELDQTALSQDDVLAGVAELNGSPFLAAGMEDLLDSSFKVGYYAYCAYTFYNDTYSRTYGDYYDTYSRTYSDYYDTYSFYSETYNDYSLYSLYNLYNLYNLYSLYTDYNSYYCTACQVCNTCQGKCETTQYVSDYIDKYIREEQINLPDGKSVINIAPQTNYDYTWSAGSISDTYVLYTPASLQLTGTTSTSEVTATCLNMSPVQTQNHIYYVRVYEYHTASGLNSKTCDFYWPSTTLLGTATFGAANQWNMLSARTNNLTAATGSKSFRIDFNNGSTAGIVWYNGLMLVDLTATYGSGSEPNKSWCDENIPYSNKPISAAEWNDVVNWVKTGAPYNLKSAPSISTVSQLAKTTNARINEVTTAIPNTFEDVSTGIPTKNADSLILDSDLVTIGATLNRAKINNLICNSGALQTCITCQLGCQICQDKRQGV